MREPKNKLRAKTLGCCLVPRNYQKKKNIKVMFGPRKMLGKGKKILKIINFPSWMIREVQGKKYEGKIWMRRT